MEEFLRFVAEIMEVDAKEISMEMAYGEFDVWDSVMFLQLVMEIEAEYAVQIPIEKYGTVKTLKDLYEFVR